MEIEKKWLLTKEQFETLIIKYPMGNKFFYGQAYLNISPEVRVREKADITDDSAFHFFTYGLTLKGNGGLARAEVNLPLKQEEFYELLDIGNLTDSDFIYKYIYNMIVDGETVTVCRVNPDLPSEFYYAEVEFETCKASEKYIPPFKFLKDVTSNPAYKMKNIWCAMHGKKEVK